MMALRGNLRDFSPTQLLNLVNLAQKTGLLTIKTGEDSAHLYFKDGKLIRAFTSQEDGYLTSILLNAGKLSPDQVKAIAARPEVRSDRQLGLLLMNAGYVTKDVIIDSAKRYMLEIVFTLFEWDEGSFEFTQETKPSDDHILVPINLESVVVEGSRRVQENEQLQGELPDLDNVALRFTDHSDASLRSINLSVEEWRVISFINPRNTIRQIALANNMDDFEIRKIVYDLLQAGLIEITRPADSIGVAGAGRWSGIEKPPAVKRSVIERLINRIQRI